MFVSQFSGKKYPEGSLPVKVVIEKRAKDYTVKDKYKVDHVIGQGWEIVREIICGLDEVEAVQTRWPAPDPIPAGFQRAFFKPAWSDEKPRRDRDDREDRRGRDRF